MRHLKINLENCYGIKKFEKELDFSTAKVVAIYAPNGSMKSSLAQVFLDIANNVNSKDRFFPSRPCTRVVKDENDVDLPKECVLVVKPYDENMNLTPISTLLVNSTLSKEYEDLHVEIKSAKNSFLKALKTQSETNKDVEKEVSTTFTDSDNKFFDALNCIKDEIATQSDTTLSTIPYDVVFDEKVISFLAASNYKAVIESYIKKYNELLAASTYFKKGTFNYYNATTIARELGKNGFFAANHSINLNADQKLEITTQQELEDLIIKEKETISNDQDLKKKFTEIEKLLKKNTVMRDFENYLQNHEELLTKLADIPAFKKEVWKSYIKIKSDLYQSLLDKYQTTAARRKEIQQQAAEERTQWEAVIDIFNKRFSVPFTLKLVNQEAVILDQPGTTPTLQFIFNDGPEKKSVDHSELIVALSTGEKKALYILNILFEIEARKKSDQESLVIVDDIADSFDYKNKYAIIQYLMDISEDSHFKQIILTHNFDFYRTVQSRFVRYKDCFMVSKSNTGIVLKEATGIKNIFVQDWKDKFFSDTKKKIASIPFMRNLLEYTKGKNDDDFKKLTSLLHWKSDSHQITVLQLDKIYCALFPKNGKTNASTNGEKLVVDLIKEEANQCLNAPDGINFENKVILAIATRLAAEQLMVKKINDPHFVTNIESNQTDTLFKKFREMFGGNQSTIGILQRVVLMTPENIHLNSFMYEPILDMSDDHLRRLYRDIINETGAVAVAHAQVD